MKAYLAIDIGASSGRHIVGWTEDGELKTEEVYRFPNGVTERGGNLTWDIDALLTHVKQGIAVSKEKHPQIESLSIDTWGVDYVLLRGDEEVRPCYAYRDGRTEAVIPSVHEKISFTQLYRRTGIQFQPFNTVYQLCADKEAGRLEGVTDFLMIPEYLMYKLCGVKSHEYTNATTGGMVSAETGEFDPMIIEALDLPGHLFCPLQKPGTILGGLSDEVKAEIGYDCQVVMVTSHDTASAVLAVPSKTADFAYISSGTWSLLGVELENAICNEQSREANFTNEGGYDYKYRFLKNIMGLWMIQSVRNEMNKAYSFAQLCAMAEEVKDFPSRVDVDEHRFFAPNSMIEEIRNACRESGQPVPETPGELATVVYQSLADCYKKSLRNLEAMTGKTYPAVNIVGGGANADYLNQLTANATGKTVYAGPTEATAIGNIVCQMLACGDLPSVSEARACIFDSFAVKTFTPEA